MPRATTQQSEFDALLASYAHSVQETARAARRLVLAVLPGATEVVDAKTRVIGYGYGSGYRDMICTLILSKGGVKLGLVGGAELPDPRQLMEGAGKVHRHVALTAPADVSRPGVKPLVRAAVAAWRRRQRPV